MSKNLVPSEPEEEDSVGPNDATVDQVSIGVWQIPNFRSSW